MTDPTSARKRILTGYRPTGKLHLGHWFGNLQNMLAAPGRVRRVLLRRRLARAHDRLGRHAATSAGSPRRWCSTGSPPASIRTKCTIYRQSDVPEVAELRLYFSMVTPMTWLERVPSYKEQREQITEKDLGNARLLPVPAAAGGRHHDRPRRRRAGGRGPAAAPGAHARDRAPLQQPRTATTSSSPPRSSPKRARASRAPTAARCPRATATRSSSRIRPTRSAPRSWA